MRLNQLTITNFGIYKDENTFSFPYSSEKKVSLILGKNGSGKTTFLNAFKICLFGSMILKNRTITKNYEAFILDKLNKDALKEALPRFSIRASFISQIHNYDGEFVIERTWSTNPSFKESVCMQRNGKMICEEEQTSFFNALYHAFPLDLFELFYLDGEKIDQLSVLNSNILDLLESSINIDLFKKLRTDLLTYASKRVNNKEVDQLLNQKEILEKDLEKLKSKIQHSYHTSDNYHKKLNSKSDEIKNLKDSLQIQSMSIDSIELSKLEQEIAELKKEIEVELSRFLPYTLVTDQLSKLLTKITNENKLGNNITINEALTAPELIDYLTSSEPYLEINKLLNKICEFYPAEQNELIHNLSNDDYYSLKNKITDLLQFNREILHAKIKILNTLEQRHQSLSQESAELEAVKAAGQLDELLSLQTEYDDFQNALKEYLESIKEAEIKLEVIEEQLKVIENALWVQLKKSNITNVLDQIHHVLDQYIEKIKEKKIKEIESHTKDMFDRLIRKKGFINDFKIENDAIYLLDKNDNRLNHSNLSAGEKQLFVLSLLYAVLQSSERRVPLMFDTLLGRLDEKHRDNVFKEFISSCPDQVIILATDSELSNIDKDYLNNLLNTEYTIDFSKSENKISEVRA
jgi:DNA sulfur modification protein DndD